MEGMKTTPVTPDLQAWNARHIRELEAELRTYRDGTVQAWSRGRIEELEAENAELREALAGPFSPAGRSHIVRARLDHMLATGKRRKRKALSNRTRWEVMERDDHRCVYCGAGPDDAVLAVDHVLPSADGGTDDASNLVTACKACNEGKGDRPIVRF